MKEFIKIWNDTSENYVTLRNLAIWISNNDRVYSIERLDPDGICIKSLKTDNIFDIQVFADYNKHGISVIMNSVQNMVKLEGIVYEARKILLTIDKMDIVEEATVSNDQNLIEENGQSYENYELRVWDYLNKEFGYDSTEINQMMNEIDTDIYNEYEQGTKALETARMIASEFQDNDLDESVETDTDIIKRVIDQLVINYKISRADAIDYVNDYDGLLEDIDCDFDAFTIAENIAEENGLY